MRVKKQINILNIKMVDINDNSFIKAIVKCKNTFL